VFDTLSERLRKTLAGLTGRGRVSEADVDTAMREVRLALLEADVNYRVVKDFVARVRERAIGAQILESLNAVSRWSRSSTRSSPRSSGPATGHSA
jgi:signal recognition particle subunit SRP54